MPLVGSKIETSNDNFGDMVRGNCLLVDKTLMIREFWESQKTSLITRPRRFGKTLNLSMLQHFFASEVGLRPTQGLFDQFAIAKVEDGEFLQRHQGQYPVIFVSFKDIKESSYQAAVNAIKNLIEELYRGHQALLNSDAVSAVDKAEFRKYLGSDINNEKLQTALKFLSEFLHKAYGKEVIILIDEYDAPLTSAYEHQFLEQLSDFLRNMFSPALKGNVHLKKGLMTGILRVSKNSMLSGLNNLEVYTVLDDKYQSYFGFTEEEVRELFENRNSVQSIDAISSYYKGYKMGDTIIYNPWSVMNFFSHKKLNPYWVLTSNDKLLKDVLVKCSDETKQLLNSLMQGNIIEGKVDVNLRYEDLVEKSSALWTLLVFCGYLTVEDSKLSGNGITLLCQLPIPNQEVMCQYIQIFQEWLQEKIGEKSYDAFLKSLVEGRVEEFTTSLTNYLFSCTSSHDFQAEADYHNFILGLLASIRETHFLFSNKEYGAGRPDCLLIPKDKSKTQGIILEFKHLHLKRNADRGDVEILRYTSRQSAEEALTQISTRGYTSAFAEHHQITRVLKIGLTFSNRIVSSAHRVCRIDEGREIEEDLSSSPIITFHF